jgi:hypothetical protein
MAFANRLAAAPGLTLAQLRSQWAPLRQGISQFNVTVYNWVRTISAAPPPEVADELGLPVDYHNPPALAVTLSCMAVFIVQDGVVAEASSEGQCLDPGLMPDWRPKVEATAG